MKFENDDYVAAVVWVLQPTQPLKEQTVSCEPCSLAKQKLVKKDAVFPQKSMVRSSCAQTFNYGHVICRLTKNLK